ncbi:hypothetical protein H5410_040477, partial [Solanum commersonii]
WQKVQKSLKDLLLLLIAIGNAKLKKIIESESKMKSMIEIERYEDNRKSYDGGEDENIRDSGDGVDDPLSFPICARDISVELYDLFTCMNDLGYFPTNIYMAYVDERQYKRKGNSFKYIRNNTKIKLYLLLYNNIFKLIVHLHLSPIVHEMKQTYMKTFKSYMNEVNNMFINTLKVELKGVVVLTSLIEVADDDKDLNGHNNITCTKHAYDHVSFTTQKIVFDTSNDRDLCEPVYLNKK